MVRDMAVFCAIFLACGLGGAFFPALVAGPTGPAEVSVSQSPITQATATTVPVAHTWQNSAAAQPTARVVGPATAQAGDLVVLDASQSEAMGFAWVLADSDKTFLPVDEGKRVVFATGTAGRYTFVLVAANADAQGKPAVALAKHSLVVGGQPPGPDPNPPGPNPNPDPPAPLPPGRFDLARQARDWAASVMLPNADRVRTAGVVASNFESIATAIAAGTVSSIDDALAKLRTQNQTSLSATEYQAWKAGWNPQFNAALSRLDGENKLPGLSETAEAFREVASGLRAVR